MGLERRRRVIGDHPAVVDHGDALRQAVGLLQVLGGEQHRGALGDQLADHLPQLAAALQVQSGGRLVQEQHGWPRHQRGGHVEAAAHPARVGPHRPVGRVLEAEPPQQLAGANADLAAGHLGEPADQPKVLLAGQVGVDRRVLAGEADPEADGDGVADDVDAQHLGPAAIGPQDGRQDADDGGLPGAVGAEQTEHGPGRHREVDPAQRRHGAEPLGQALDANGRIRGQGVPPRWDARERRRRSPRPYASGVRAARPC
jgi:hypothetical protein